MASEAEVERICAELTRAVHAMMDPSSSPTVRMQAMTHCENFKEQSPPAFGVQCGLFLSGCKGLQGVATVTGHNQSNAGIVRHFGLKLVDRLTSSVTNLEKVGRPRAVL